VYSSGVLPLTELLDLGLRLAAFDIEIHAHHLRRVIACDEVGAEAAVCSVSVLQFMSTVMSL
jgi:hypothetical protein